MTYLPAELLHKIFTSFVADTMQQQQRKDLYLPKDFLLPLLRVCKSWHPIAECYLYQSISIGSSFFGRDHFACPPGRKKRRAYVIAEHLLSTLQDHPRLASLITTLRMGIVEHSEISRIQQKSIFEIGRGVHNKVILVVEKSWMNTCISILRLCTHVEHVEIRGLWFDPLDTLFDELGKKSLQSFVIDGKHLLTSYYEDHPRLIGLLFKTMALWPHLRRVFAQGLLTRPRNFISDDNIETDPKCARVCTETEEVHFDFANLYGGRFSLQEDELQTLLTLCPNLKKLTMPLVGENQQYPAEYIHAVAHILQGWAQSLEYATFLNNLVHGNEALLGSLSTFVRLRELHLYGVKWNIGALTNLLRLERLVCVLDGPGLQDLAALLDDKQNFPALLIVQVSIWLLDRHVDLSQDLKAACYRRQIHLSRFTDRVPSRVELVYDLLPGDSEPGSTVLNHASDCRTDYV